VLDVRRRAGRPRRRSAPTTATRGTDAAATSTTDPGPPTTTAPESTQPPVTTAATTTIPERTYDFSAIGPVVQQFVDDRGLNGAGLVVVDRVDGIVHEQYWGEFSADRVSLIASASKMLAAGVLMRLDDQGLLDVDAPVAEAVEWGTGNPEVTPAQLLSNSSGLVGLGPDPGYPPYLCQFLPGGSLADCGAQIFTTPADDADVIPSGHRVPVRRRAVAGRRRRRRSGVGPVVGELVEETYVEPCGVDSLGFNNHWTQFGPIGFSYPKGFDADPSTLAATENPNIEGGAYITAPDYARLLLMQLRDGRCGDEQVLSPEAVAAMHADRIGDVYGGSVDGDGYGLGWWVDRATGRRIDPGAYGAFPWLDLDSGHGAYLVIEATSGSDRRSPTCCSTPWPTPSRRSWLMVLCERRRTGRRSTLTRRRVLDVLCERRRRTTMCAHTRSSSWCRPTPATTASNRVRSRIEPSRRTSLDLTTISWSTLA
jgi:CubicO group peptidase (beta-lactamase class C family)